MATATTQLNKAAVSLISLEPGPTQPIPNAASPSRGLLAALVYDSLGDLLSQIQDDFQPIQLHRAATAEEVVALVQNSDTALLFGEVAQPDDAFQLLLALRQLKTQLGSGQVRVIVNCTLPSKTFTEKLRAYGVSEVVAGVDQPDAVVQKARMITELLLFRRAVSRLPGGKLSSIGLAFMLSEWVTQNGIDYPSIAHLYCACLSAACGGARFEFFRQAGADASAWDCIATSDSTASQWIDLLKSSQIIGAVEIRPKEVRIEWIGERKGALVCSSSSELTPEQSRLLQAAADLAAGFVLLDQPSMAFKSSG